VFHIDFRISAYSKKAPKTIAGLKGAVLLAHSKRRRSLQ
jgi:hypothetical protein